MHELRKEVLLEDERGRGFAAVIKYGQYLFVSGADGHRNSETHQIDPSLDGKPIEQCRNSYGLIARRLQRAGYSGGCAVWIENFTSGQEWRLPRMALWPEYFGEVEHGLAVSYGAKTNMSGINMITTVVMGVVPDVERIPIVPQPGRGRAGRVIKTDTLIYIIGTRFKEREVTSPSGKELTADDPTWLDRHQAVTFDVLEDYLKLADADLQSFVRVDACIRDTANATKYREYYKQRLGGACPFAGYTVGVPLGGRGEHEIGGLAVAPGVPKEIAWRADRPDEAQAVRAGGLVFASGCSGVEDATTGRALPELKGDAVGQAKQALRRVEASLNHFDIDLSQVLRLDVWLRDIAFDDQFIAVARDVFGADAPTMTFVGGDTEYGAEVEVSAVAAAGV